MIPSLGKACIEETSVPENKKNCAQHYDCIVAGTRCKTHRLDRFENRVENTISNVTYLFAHQHSVNREACYIINVIAITGEGSLVGTYQTLLINCPVTVYHYPLV